MNSLRSLNHQAKVLRSFLRKNLIWSEYSINKKIVYSASAKRLPEAIPMYSNGNNHTLVQRSTVRFIKLSLDYFIVGWLIKTNPI